MERDEALKMLKERLIQARTYFLLVFSESVHTDAVKKKKNNPKQTKL